MTNRCLPKPIPVGSSSFRNCRRLVGTTEPCQIREQLTFTDGRIVVAGQKGVRRPGKRVDYLLRNRSDFSIAVVEAKASYKSPSDGLQQAKDYAELLGLEFAYATNGHEIIEFDYLTGRESRVPEFPTPAELWQRLTAGENLTPEAGQRLLAPTYSLTGKPRISGPKLAL